MINVLINDAKVCAFAADSVRDVRRNARAVVERDTPRKTRPDHWTPNEVSAWLRSVEGLEQYADAFLKNEYTGGMLLGIVEKDLKNILNVKRQNRERILGLVPSLIDEYEKEMVDLLEMETQKKIATLIDPAHEEAGVARTTNPLLRSATFVMLGFLTIDSIADAPCSCCLLLEILRGSNIRSSGILQASHFVPSILESLLTLIECGSNRVGAVASDLMVYITSLQKNPIIFESQVRLLYVILDTYLLWSILIMI
jgi:hypothetical protein